MDGYRWLVLGHILSAIVWLGAGIMGLVARRRMEVAGEAAVRAFHDFETWSGSRFFGPAAFATLGFGIALVAASPAWAFSQAWVWLALVLVVASMIIGAGYYGTRNNQIAALREEHGEDHPELQRLVAQVSMVSRVEVAMLVFVVFLMVFKPGA